jgi:hypothetical protein
MRAARPRRRPALYCHPNTVCYWPRRRSDRALGGRLRAAVELTVALRALRVLPALAPDPTFISTVLRRTVEHGRGLAAAKPRLCHPERQPRVAVNGSVPGWSRCLPRSISAGSVAPFLPGEHERVAGGSAQLVMEVDAVVCPRG